MQIANKRNIMKKEKIKRNTAQKKADTTRAHEVRKPTTKSK